VSSAPRMSDSKVHPVQFGAFNKQVIDCVVGGVSALDIPRLNIHSMDEAKQFVLAYGYNLDVPEDRDELWSTHRRAVALIREQLLDAEDKIPEELFDPAQLTDISQLLLFASSENPEDIERQRWACAILRVMHVYVHLRNDLFSAFRDEIQTQILRPLQDAILQDDIASAVTLGPSQPDGGVRLHKFEIKPFKTTASSVVKLLARSEKVALTLLDKLGVRFVTRTVYDSFRVIRFLVDNHLVSYPHIIPDQSNNTLYPVNLFLETMEKVKAEGLEDESEKIEELLKSSLESARTRAEYLQKENEFSGPDYRFIKFINRKLITVPIGDGEQKRAFRFFYPYEIQVMDYETYVSNLSGPMAHDEYKNRQRRRARRRVLGLKPGGGDE
jgi:uncharacterized protein (TIGR04562 family)